MTKKRKPAGPGRPELRPKERRSVLMQFRVTEAEAEAIRRKAEKAGQSASDWLREHATS